MADSKEMLSGVFAPMCTPFVDDEVSYDGIKRNIELMNATGLRGYLFLGTNGEFKTLSEDEKKKMLGLVVKTSGNDKVVMAGTGYESTRETIRMTNIAADTGVALASILSPSFFVKRMDNETMINHVLEVADASPIPVVLYNNPPVAAGLTIGPEVIKAVCGHENVVGLKDSSKDTWRGNVAYDGEDFSVLAGSADFFFDLMEKGGSGGVLSLANVFPDVCADLYNLYINGEKEEAMKLNNKILSLNKMVSGSYGVAGVKYAMDLVGFAGGNPRRPLKALTDEQKKSLKADLSNSGFLKS